MFYYLFLCLTDKHKKKTIKKEERKEKQKKSNEYILEMRKDLITGHCTL